MTPRYTAPSYNSRCIYGLWSESAAVTGSCSDLLVVNPLVWSSALVFNHHLSSYAHKRLSPSSAFPLPDIGSVHRTTDALINAHNTRSNVGPNSFSLDPFVYKALAFAGTFTGGSRKVLEFRSSPTFKTPDKNRGWRVSQSKHNPKSPEAISQHLVAI
jgi:hypothetical protein